MKKAFLFFIFLAAVTSYLFVGCELPADDTSGDDPRDAYVGEWQFYESFAKSTENQSYLVTITKDPDNSSQVILGNFANSGSNSISAKGLVTSTQIVVSSQKMSNNMIVDGNGKFTDKNKTIMDWTLSVTAGGNLDLYTATATKQ